MTGPSRQVREQVWARSVGRCERCGTALNGAVSLHHRRPRGAGGSKDAVTNSPVNLLYLCGSGTTGCHGWIESFRTLSYASGWLVHSWDDPARVPVDLHGRGPVLLSDDGCYGVTSSG